MIGFAFKIGPMEVVALFLFGAYFVFVCIPWIARKLGYPTKPTAPDAETDLE